jgi:hypothetical protein
VLRLDRLQLLIQMADTQVDLWPATNKAIWIWIWISCLRSNYEPCAVKAGPLLPKCEYCPVPHHHRWGRIYPETFYILSSSIWIPLYYQQGLTAQNAAMKWIKLKVSSQMVTLQ